MSTDQSIEQTQYHEVVEEEQAADRNSEDNSEDEVEAFNFLLLIFKVGIKLKLIAGFLIEIKEQEEITK